MASFGGDRSYLIGLARNNNSTANLLSSEGYVLC